MAKRRKVAIKVGDEVLADGKPGIVTTVAGMGDEWQYEIGYNAGGSGWHGGESLTKYTPPKPLKVTTTYRKRTPAEIEALRKWKEWKAQQEDK